MDVKIEREKYCEIGSCFADKIFWLKSKSFHHFIALLESYDKIRKPAEAKR